MDAFVYGIIEERYFEQALAEMGTYKRLTTFYSDLSIAEYYGKESIIDTYKRVCEHWISNYKYFTEFVMCLNYKSWEWSARGDEDMVELYTNLFIKAQEKYDAYYEGKEEEMTYYYTTTD